ncbi:DUF2798 domain-containing protein [Butyricicoccus sp.]|uniref:DUF2798 domain-containing protein n=1 Tax=Butyricicoccus sp. TaxID=2049021 RepID=UPI003F14E046
MPRSKKEGIMFSFLMSAIMIFVMAALNYAVRTGSMTMDAWRHAVTAFVPGYIFGMVCDLFLCTPFSRKLTEKMVGDCKEGVRIFVIRFSMVVTMTVCMTVFGIVAGGARGAEIFMGSCVYFPYNFTIALPVQMLVVAPFSAWVVRKLCRGRQTAV